MALDLSISLIRSSVIYSELIAAITGTIFFYKYKKSPIRYFLFLLWLIVISEFVGGYITKHNVSTLIYVDENGLKYNKWVYNTLYFVTFNIIFYIYNKYLLTIRYKKWIKYFAYTYTIIFAVNWIFIQNYVKQGSELPRIIGSIFLIISIIFYLIELLKSEKVMVFHRLLLFWISIGLLLFYAGTIPFFLKINTYMLFPEIHKLFLIRYILAILMYLTFTFGFIWSKKE